MPALTTVSVTAVHRSSPWLTVVDCVGWWTLDCCQNGRNLERGFCLKNPAAAPTLQDFPSCSYKIFWIDYLPAMHYLPRRKTYVEAHTP